MSNYHLRNINLSEGKLQEIRNKIYHSKEDGYFIFKNFLADNEVNHVVKFWCNSLIPGEQHEVFKGKRFIKNNSPNFYASRKNNESESLAYYNYFWNDAVDQFTHTISMEIVLLRNMIESKPIYFDLFPNQTGRSVSYRLVISKNGKNIVAPHKDWTTPPFFDPARLQATLILTEHGVDYSGKGFVFENNQGKKNIFGKDIKVSPGDLILWKYNNDHSIQDISSDSNQKGFVRIIFPPETINGASKNSFVINTLLKSKIVQNKLIPLYKKIRNEITD